MSDLSNPAETLKLPTGKLGQPTTETAIGRASSAVEASKAIAENGPQITRPAVELVTPSATVEATEVTTQAALPFIDMYRDFARMSAGHVLTMCNGWISLGRGIRDMQVQWIDTIGRSAGVKPELWQAQRDLYVQGLDRMLETSSRMIEIATKPLTKETTH